MPEWGKDGLSVSRNQVQRRQRATRYKKKASRESKPSDCGDRLELDMITDLLCVANDRAGRPLKIYRVNAKLFRG
jgi:hypothetical protein